MNDSLMSLFGIIKPGQMDLENIRSQQWGQRMTLNPITGIINITFESNTKSYIEDLYVDITLLRYKILRKHCL